MIDFLRINCILDDDNAGNFNSVLKSIVVDYLYELYPNSGQFLDILSYIKDNLGIEVQADHLLTLIVTYPQIEVTELDDDTYLKLAKKKKVSIDSQLDKNNVRKFIIEFLESQDNHSSKSDVLLGMLHESLFQNISNISSTELSSIIYDKIADNYTQSDIDLFNDFLSWNNDKKNQAVYFLFLKTFEFAVVTSNRGITNFSSNLFSGKEYCLDANVILRALGVNGPEREKTILDLLRSCNHQGISFYYTVPTQKELLRVYEAAEIKINGQKESWDVSDSYITDYNHTVNQTMFWHFLSLRKKGIVNNASSYTQHLRSRLREIESLYEIDYRDIDPKISGIKAKELQTNLYKGKKAKNVSYTQTAAEVDAKNLVYIRDLSGTHFQNYTDIKSFYLTTDRTLHAILSENKPNNIPLTLLPSQLFLLHQQLSTDQYDKAEDFKTFINFIKKRTTEFKLSGEDVLNYIEELKGLTRDEQTIKKLIKAFSDKRFEETSKSISSESTYKSIKSFADTELDKILSKTQESHKILGSLLNDLEKVYYNKLKLTKNIFRAIDIIFHIGIASFLFYSNSYLAYITLTSIEIVFLLFRNNQKFINDNVRKTFMYFISKSDLFNSIQSKAKERNNSIGFFDKNFDNIW